MGRQTYAGAQALGPKVTWFWQIKEDHGCFEASLIERWRSVTPSVSLSWAPAAVTNAGWQSDAVPESGLAFMRTGSYFLDLLGL